jgi:hypothetical protein
MACKPNCGGCRDCAGTELNDDNGTAHDNPTLQRAGRTWDQSRTGRRGRRS